MNSAIAARDRIPSGDFFGPELAEFDSGFVVATQRWQGHHDLEAIRTDLHEGLRTRWWWYARRVLIHEFHRHREELGAPPDPSSAVGYDSFAARLATPRGWSEVLAGYPSLRSFFTRTRHQTTQRIVRLLARYDADRAYLIETGLPAGELHGVAAFVGDPHGGDHVTVLQAATGRLVYKPRDARPDQWWAHFLGLVEPELRLAAPRVVAGEGYTWHEYLSDDLPVTAACARRFDRRLGAGVALATVAGLTDLHTENVLAHGEHPVFIDVETLFTGNGLVTSTGLLPGCGPPGPELAGISLAGIRSGVVGSRYVEAHPGTDAMALVPDSAERAHSRHRPLLADRTRAPVDTTAVREGFEQAMEHLRRHRHTLPVGHAEFVVRRIARPSQSYGRFIEALTQPDALADPARRSHLLGLLQPAGGVDVSAERVAVEAGDIPVVLETAQPAHVCGENLAILLRAPAAACHAVAGCLSEIAADAPALPDDLARAVAEPDPERALVRTLARLDARAGRAAGGRCLRGHFSRESGWQSDDVSLAGSGGIALLMAARHRLDPGSSRSRAALRTEAARIVNVAGQGSAQPLCGYFGTLSCVALLQELAAASSDPQIWRQRDLLLDKALHQADLEIHRLDVVGGLGSGVALLADWVSADGRARAPERLQRRASSVIARAAERLIEAIEVNPASGLAHGYHGHAWALARAVRAPESPRADIVAALQRYLARSAAQVTTGDSESQQDRRSTPSGGSKPPGEPAQNPEAGRGAAPSPTWCWGVTGIVLADTTVAQELSRVTDAPTDAARAHASRLLDVRWPDDAPQCLCHGPIGTAAAAWSLGHSTGHPGLLRMARTLADAVPGHARAGTARVDEAGWGTGMGLLTGVAGVALTRALVGGVPGLNPIGLERSRDPADG
ncbi:MAG: DUF4135 domain-containing protein [Actinomycetales bacterium]